MTANTLTRLVTDCQRLATSSGESRAYRLTFAAYGGLILDGHERSGSSCPPHRTQIHRNRHDDGTCRGPWKNRRAVGVPVGACGRQSSKRRGT